MDGAQVAVDGAVADPLSVLGSLFDGFDASTGLVVGVVE